MNTRLTLSSKACSSMFACTEVLHLSEGESYLRIAAARAARRHPMLLEMLTEGPMHLSGIGKLAAHLTDANCGEVLVRATHKSKREIEELVAELMPRPDAPSTVRKMPARVEPTPPVQLRPDAVKNDMPARPGLPPPAPVVQPLAPERYKVAFTASTELREKLERLQALMDDDLAAVIEAAVTEKIERLEAKRYAETKAPRKKLDETDTSPSSRYILRRSDDSYAGVTVIDARSSTRRAGAVRSAEDSTSITMIHLAEEATIIRPGSGFSAELTTSFWQKETVAGKWCRSTGGMVGSPTCTRSTA